MIGFWSHHQVAPKEIWPYGLLEKLFHLFFGIPLALHYLCHCIAKIGVGSGKQKNLRFYLAFRSPCTIFAIV